MKLYFKHLKMYGFRFGRSVEIGRGGQFTPLSGGQNHRNLQIGYYFNTLITSIGCCQFLFL